MRRTIVCRFPKINRRPRRFNVISLKIKMFSYRDVGLIYCAATRLLRCHGRRAIDFELWSERHTISTDFYRFLFLFLIEPFHWCAMGFCVYQIAHFVLIVHKVSNSINGILTSCWSWFNFTFQCFNFVCMHQHLNSLSTDLQTRASALHKFVFAMFINVNFPFSIFCKHKRFSFAHQINTNLITQLAAKEKQRRKTIKML